MRARILVIPVLSMILISSWAIAETRPPNPKKGETIYQQHCLCCHGQPGDGLGPEARDRLAEQEMIDVLSYLRTLVPFLPVT